MKFIDLSYSKHLKLVTKIVALLVLIQLPFGNLLAESAPSVEPVCEYIPEKNYRSLNVDDKIAYINFPGGRQILIVGHTHSSDKNDREVFRFINSTSSNALVEEHLDLFIEEEARFLNSFDQTYELLQRLLASGEYDFVAEELPPGTIEKNQETSLFIVNEAIKRMEKRGLRKDFLEQVPRILSPSLYELKRNKPTLFDNVTIVGVDVLNTEITPERSIYEDKLAEVIDEFDTFRFENNYDGTNLKELEDLIYYLGAVINKDVSVEEIMRSHVYDKFPQDSYEHFRKLVQVSRELNIKFDRPRDHAMLKELLAQEGSGIYIVGATHLASLSPLITNYCSGKKPL